MKSTLQRTALFVLYQLTVALGIALFPVAVLSRRLGITLPLGRVIEHLDRAHERTTP